MKGRIIKAGDIEAEALVTYDSFCFFGSVDTKTGKIIEKNHELEGKNISGKIFVFPYGKGTTVTPYTMYALKKNGKAPLAIINIESEPLLAVGAIISKIPMIDQIDIKKIKTGDKIKIKGNIVEII